MVCVYVCLLVLCDWISVCSLYSRLSVLCGLRLLGLMLCSFLSVGCGVLGSVGVFVYLRLLIVVGGVLNRLSCGVCWDVDCCLRYVRCLCVVWIIGVGMFVSCVI